MVKELFLSLLQWLEQQGAMEEALTSAQVMRGHLNCLRVALKVQKLLVVLEEEPEQMDVTGHCCHHCLAQTALPPVLPHPLSLRVPSS